MTPRYAVFYAPSPDTPLWAFGSSLIGYDAESGAALPHPTGVPCPAPEWRALTSEPRRYGFHGTLKAPFSLAQGSTEDDLLADARAFALRQRPFEVARLHVATIGAFVALVPVAPSSPLGELAAEAVRFFEPLRAPLTPADRERRLAAPLSSRQIRNLEDWGYPYVFEDFRFHMTLTGPLPDTLREPVRAALQDLYAGLDEALCVDAIAVFKQEDRAGAFRVLARLPFDLPRPVRPAWPGTPRRTAS